MSYSIHADFLNGNDEKYLNAVNGTPEQLKEWEEENGTILDNPGAVIDTGNAGIVEETEDEYGGILIAIADIPKGATHIHVCRS